MVRDYARSAGKRKVIMGDRLLREDERVKYLENILPNVAMYLDGFYKNSDVHGREFLSGPDGEELYFSIKNETGKGSRLHVRGDYTVGNTYRSPPSELADETTSISMSLEKSGEQMAAEIERRLLPGYRKVLAWACQRDAEEKQYEARRIALSKRFAKAIGGEYVVDKDRGREYFNTPSIGGVYLYNISASDSTIQFEVRSCPAELAVKIAETIRLYGEKRQGKT